MRSQQMSGTRCPKAHAQNRDGGNIALRAAPFCFADRMRRARRFSLLAFVVFVAVPNCAFKLNVPKVLLPFSREMRVPFVLEAERGCYSWRSMHYNVAAEPLYKNGTACSQKALLSAQSTQPTKLSSAVIAEEHVTGHMLRCDVMVDVIDSIEILSRTREIYVEDSPLELAVRALDVKGNTFSSLSGMVFEWSIAKDEDLDSIELSEKIRILKYSEADYSPPNHIVELERAEKQGDRILVSGMTTGAAVVKVRIHESTYKKVAAAAIRLLVLENIVLIPAHDVHLLVGAFIKYRVAKVVQGKITELEFPLEHYELELRDHVAAPGASELPVAKLEGKAATVRAVQLGQSSLVVVHRNVHMRAASGLPNCTIHVVEAGFLDFSVYPGDRWVLEAQREYTITVEVYDSDSTKVYLSDNLRITHHLPKEYFEVLTSSLNGSYYVVRVLKAGSTGIRAELVSVLQQDGSGAPLPTAISREQEVKIFHPITLSKSFLAFPWHPTAVLYQYRVQVKGGSGNFSWISSNQTVATVTIKGAVSAGLAQGNCTVQARDAQNPFHYAEIQVFVEPLAELKLMPLRADVEVGHAVVAPLQAYFTHRETRQHTAFTDCSLLPLDISMEKRGVFVLPEGGNQKPDLTFCSSFQIEARSVGHTSLTVRVNVHQQYLETNATFAAYEPLKAVNLVEMALVTWKAAKEIVFEGGPGPWVLEPSHFFSELKMEHEDKIKYVQIHLPTQRKVTQYVYQVVCLELGEQVLTFHVGNRASQQNPAPAVETAMVTFICAVPASMTVSPAYGALRAVPPCLLPQHSKQLIPISSRRSTVLELAMFDGQQRKFDNFSSLVLQWKSSNRSLAHFSDARATRMVLKDDGSGQTRLHGQQLLEVHQIKGTVRVEVSFVKYRTGGGPQAASGLFTSVEFLLVDDVMVLPDNVTVYNHPAVKEQFSLVEGSGYFLVNSSKEGIVNVRYLEADGAIEVTPLQPGFLSLAVRDSCLASLAPVAAQVHVSDVQEVEVDLNEKVEIGSSITATVRVLGSQRLPLRSKYFKYMKLQLQAASPIVTLVQVEEVGEYSQLHTLHAVAVGQTTLVATAWDKMGRKITSAPRKIEVFPPFKLIPRKITLIPHNVMQVMSEGGPQPQSIVHFFVTNRSVAEVSSLGHVTAKAVGATTIQGTVQVVNEDTGRVTVFLQDQVELEVIPLKAVRIHVPSTRLIAGTEMPVFVVGLNNMLTPFSFSNANPELSFQWSVSKRDVLELLPRHTKVSIQLPAQNNVAMVVYTRAAGRTSIRVKVQCLNASAGQFEGNVAELSDEVQVLVFEKLFVFSPLFSTEQILMTTNSQLKLYTNREGAASVSFQILQCYPNSSVLEERDQGLLRAGPISGIAALEVTSVEQFGVNQTIITSIQIAPISYLRINVSPQIYTSSGISLAAFPLGMSLLITVEFYNSIGEKFHAQHAQLHLSVNRDDLLLIRPANKNHTYVAQAVSRGVTLLTVQDRKHPGVVDYIPVPVDCAIQPELPRALAVGDVVCFSSPLVNQEGDPGTWHVSPPTMLSIDSVSGAALAKSSGTATVFHEIPGIVKTYREVAVNGSSQLHLQTGQKSFLTNAPNSSAFHVLITTSSGTETLQGSCSSAQLSAITQRLVPQSLLQCNLKFSSTVVDVAAGDVFLVSPEFSTQEGLYVCVITVKPQPSSALLALSTANTSVRLVASLSSDTHSVLIPFLPAFYLPQSELAFSSTQLTDVLSVMGAEKVLENLEVQSISPAVEVLPSEFSSKPGFVHYTVRALNLSSLQQKPAASIIISCALTGQRDVVTAQAVMVEHPPGQHGALGLHWQLAGSYQILLFTLFAVLGSTAVTYLAYNAFVSRLQSLPLVYVSNLVTPQPGYTHPPSSIQGGSRTQMGLWSVKS
ncbi:nuclear pore membrane glycoprotein 210-like isoform X2 [Coturnix japonica]|uniref:nuclear pore membrane glycoprotein 210-like isoform X2 n=1 Tax=Coturnix japonica TaxID=93934 RepID=UPI000777D83C|nr:nuclear pore membrane glycoprotein 210-like isoform X2 [Coturnix japonica]